MVLMKFKSRKLVLDSRGCSYSLNLPSEYVQAFNAQKGDRFEIAWESASGLLLIHPRRNSEDCFDKVRLVENYFKELYEDALRQRISERTLDNSSVVEVLD